MSLRTNGFEPSAYAIPPPRPEQPRRESRGRTSTHASAEAHVGRDSDPRRRDSATCDQSGAPIRRTRIMLVWPATPGGEPATMTTRSPSAIRPLSISALSTCRIMSSVWPTIGTRKDSTPQFRVSVALGLLDRGERQDRDRRAQPGQPAGRVAGVGEGDQELRVDPLRHLGGGLGDHAAGGVRVPVDARASGPCRGPRCSPRSGPWSARSAPGTRRRWSRPTASPRRRRRGSRWRRRRPRPGSAAGEEIIDSSIWVATITGLAQRRAAVTIFFWTSGTSSSGSSTPRSPRATMNASKASMISSRLSTACGFSSLAITGDAAPSSSITWCTMLDVVGAADEGQRDHVDAVAQRPAQVLGVLLAHRRHADGDAGQVDALVVADRPADDDLGDHVGLGDLGRPPARSGRRRSRSCRRAGRRPADPCTSSSTARRCPGCRRR